MAEWLVKSSLVLLLMIEEQVRDLHDPEAHTRPGLRFGPAKVKLVFLHPSPPKKMSNKI